MSARERRKGATGELEVVGILKDHGWRRASRTSDGRKQEERGDFAYGPQGVHLEAKRCEAARPWAWWEQATRDAAGTGLEVAVTFRRSRSPWLVLLELADVLPLWRERETALVPRPSDARERIAEALRRADAEMRGTTVGVPLALASDPERNRWLRMADAAIEEVA